MNSNASTCSRRRSGLALVVIVLSCTQGLFAQLRLDQLCLKGTHNSYASQGGGNDCPVMEHHPVLQVDDFGVWVLEFDFGILQQGSLSQLIVGHNSATDRWSPMSWGFYLEDWLSRILNETRSLTYRPILLLFEYKSWGDDSFDPPSVHNSLLRDCLISVFGRQRIFGPSDFGGGPWPTVPELAGKIIVLKIYGDTSSAEDVLFPDDVVFRRKISDTDVAGMAQELQKWRDQGYRILAPDQYQYDWTFGVTDPPNPVCVDSSAPSTFTCRNDEDTTFAHRVCWLTGDSCAFDVKGTELCWPVSQHGTFRFPFDTVTEAKNLALPGWTILIRPGNYPETLTIGKPLILEADGGIVTIGQ